MVVYNLTPHSSTYPGIYQCSHHPILSDLFTFQCHETMYRPYGDAKINLRLVHKNFYDILFICFVTQNDEISNNLEERRSGRRPC